MYPGLNILGNEEAAQGKGEHGNVDPISMELGVCCGRSTIIHFVILSCFAIGSLKEFRVPHFIEFFALVDEINVKVAHHKKEL